MLKNNLKDKTILVVGASRGIGLCIARSLIDHQAEVIALSRTTSNLPCQKFKVDINDLESINIFISYLKSSQIRLNGIVISAAKSLKALANHDNKKSSLQDPKIFRDLINSNLVSIYELIYLTEPYLCENSSIVILSSIGATLAFPDNTGYQCSKAGIESMTRSLSYELAHKGIRANSLSLGYFKTDMTKSSFENERLRNERTQRTILKRWGEPNEVCGAVNFLLSENSSYITASSIAVDGGWHAKGL